ncbi:hypothetical protein TNCV_3783891 [Trichonephila clavipes]|nr:hypothetical protein TNCV_3783891 [Trichonephila clavipes]
MLHLVTEAQSSGTVSSNTGDFQVMFWSPDSPDMSPIKRVVPPGKQNSCCRATTSQYAWIAELVGKA